MFLAIWGLLRGRFLVDGIGPRSIPAGFGSVWGCRHHRPRDKRENNGAQPRSSPARHGAIAARADAICRRTPDALHEGWAQQTDPTGIRDMRRLREIIEIPFINDDP